MLEQFELEACGGTVLGGVPLFVEMSVHLKPSPNSYETLGVVRTTGTPGDCGRFRGTHASRIRTRRVQDDTEGPPLAGLATRGILDPALVPVVASVHALEEASQ